MNIIHTIYIGIQLVHKAFVVSTSLLSVKQLPLAPICSDCIPIAPKTLVDLFAESRECSSKDNLKMHCSIWIQYLPDFICLLEGMT